MPSNPGLNPSSILTLNAHCHCRLFTHTVTAPRSVLPFSSSTCSCSLCRHGSGSLFSTWISGLSSFASKLPADSPDRKLISGTDMPDISKLTRYQFGKSCEWCFCPNCGCTCLSIEPNQEGKLCWGLASGIVQGPLTGLMRRRIEFLGSTGDGGLGAWLQNVTEIEGIEAKKWVNGENEEPGIMIDEMLAGIVELGRKKVKNLEGKQDERDRLKFRCGCGSIQGYLTRPHKTPNLGPEEQPWLHGDSKYVAEIDGCESCRLTSGFEYAGWAFIPQENVFLGEEGKPFDPKNLPPFLREYSSSDKVRRYFCGTCGANVIYSRLDRKDAKAIVDVGVGLLESATGSRAEDWLHWGSDRFLESDAADTAFAKLMNDGIDESHKEHC